MADTLAFMARPPKKKSQKGGEQAARPTPRYPSRDKVKYAGIPSDYWSLLDSLTQDGEKYEGRSVAYLAKIAVRAFLQAEGLVDDKGKPKTGPAAG